VRSEEAEARAVAEFVSDESPAAAAPTKGDPQQAAVGELE
jgi:hypothetical protein